ncbi:MAG: hypothetical protein ABIC40_05180, partial [bacterium]
MRKEFSSAIILFFVSAFLVAGCSDNPASPNSSGPDAIGFTNDSSGQDDSGHMCLGYYSVLLDTESMEVDIVPVRSGDLHLNLVNVLNSTMGVTAHPVPGECDPVNGLFVMDVTLAHPFASKEQFAGFDVKGILITSGTLSVPPLIFADAGETDLENADGYTRWWNPTEFTSPGVFGYVQGKLANETGSALTATVNPYKLFADILGADDSLNLVTNEPTGNDEGRAVFRAGSTNTRRYEIRFPLNPGPVIRFGYAIDCSWTLPSPNPPTEVPDNFPIQANQPEAYRVKVTDSVNTLYFDSEPGVGGGVLRLSIDINDWQGQIGGDIPGQITAVKIFAPDLMIGEAVANLMESNSIMATYIVDLTGTAIPTHAGDVKIVCKVESNDGSKYKQASQPAPNSPLSAYQVLTLDIPDPVCVGDANDDWIDAVELDFDSQIKGQVCLPDDYRDFYSLEIPPGFKAKGTINLWAEASSTRLEIYDSSQVLVDKKDVSGGVASFSFDDLDLKPDDYYFRVYTANETQVVPYFLELVGYLTNVTPWYVRDVTPPELFCKPYHIWLYDDYAYMLGLGHWVYDIKQPGNPIFVGGNLVGDVWGETQACFNHPFCYYVEGLSGGPPYDQINLIDFTNPASPVRTEGVLVPGPEISAMCMNSTHLFVATDETPNPKLTIYGYSDDPTDLYEVGSTALPGIAIELALIGFEGPGTQIVAVTEDTIYTYSVENPSSITQTGMKAMFPGYTCNDIATHDNYICIADVNVGND